jgi:hypothetical protein
MTDQQLEALGKHFGVAGDRIELGFETLERAIVPAYLRD